MDKKLLARLDNGVRICYNYKYDGLGNINAIHENGKIKIKYTYEKLNRILREDNIKNLKKVLTI